MSYSARNAALNIISDVEDGGYLNLTLKKYLDMVKKPEDKRFATALASCTIENIFRLDYIISQFTRGKKIQKVIKNILRTGVCQLMYFDSVPVSAAVNESVKLCTKCGKTQLKGFVNGVLRNIAASLGNIEYPKQQSDPAGYLSVIYSYPEWLCDKYIADFGFEKAEALVSYKGGDAYTSVRLCAGKNVPNMLKDAKKGDYAENMFYVKNISSVQTLEEYKNGSIAVQGEASVLCVDALGLKKSDSLLDVCAAPGGKSAYAAEKCAFVMAGDVREHRVELIKSTFLRLGIKNAEAFCGDAAEFNVEFENAFDAVLIDAPCSALGLLYRKPDIKISKKADDLPELIRIQRAILQNCCKYVKKGGKLLYSTCTVNADENINNIKWFLQNDDDFELDDISKGLPQSFKERAGGGYLQLMPDTDGIDGFFMCALRRKK